MDFERVRLPLLVAIGVCGLLVIAVSFMPWVRFEGDDIIAGGPDRFSFSVAGNELSRLRGPSHFRPSDVADQPNDVCSCRADVGDGYLVGGLGVLVVAMAAIAALLPYRTRVLAAGIVVAGLGALIVAGYNAAGDWRAVGAAEQNHPFVTLDGSVRFELYLLATLAGGAALLAGVLWGLASAARRAEQQAEDEWYEEAVEGV